jgi:hypothetical protein
MAINVTTTPIPEPLEVPRDILDQLSASIYLSLVVLAVSTLPNVHMDFKLTFPLGLKAYTWDWIISISEEVELCSRGKIGPPTAVYFLSR